MICQDFSACKILHFTPLRLGRTVRSLVRCTTESASAVVETVEALNAKDPLSEGIHMETYSVETAVPQAQRRKTMRQVTARAISQTQRIGGGDLVACMEAGEVIGQALASVAIGRRCTGEAVFDLASLLEHVLGLDPVAETAEQRARQALFGGICKEYEKAVQWGYERGAFQLNANEEAEQMRFAVGLAGKRVKQWMRCRESLGVAA